MTIDDGTLVRLTEVIESSGLGDVDTFLTLLAQSVHEIRAQPGQVSPARHFTKNEIEEMRSGGFQLQPYPKSEVDPAARTAAKYLGLLAESLTVSQVAKVLKVNSSRVRQRLADKTLFGVKVGREWRIPRFQFSGKRLVQGISAVTAALPGDLHPVATWNWFHTPNPDLYLEGEQVSPLEWLASGGNPSAAADLAEEI